MMIFSHHFKNPSSMLQRRLEYLKYRVHDLPLNRRLGLRRTAMLIKRLRQSPPPTILFLRDKGRVECNAVRDAFVTTLQIVCQVFLRGDEAELLQHFVSDEHGHFSPFAFGGVAR